MLQIFEDEEILFYADNIPKSLEHIMEQLNDTSTYKMPEDVKEGFDFGVRTTISILRQYLNQSINEQHITFYNPNVKVSEEMDIQEIIQWATKKFYSTKKQIMIVTRNGDRLFGNVYEGDPDSPRPFPDYSKSTMQDYRELDKFKEELKIEEIAVERWAVVEVE